MTPGDELDDGPEVPDAVFAECVRHNALLGRLARNGDAMQEQEKAVTPLWTQRPAAQRWYMTDDASYWGYRGGQARPVILGIDMARGEDRSIEWRSADGKRTYKEILQPVVIDKPLKDA